MDDKKMDDRKRDDRKMDDSNMNESDVGEPLAEGAPPDEQKAAAPAPLVSEQEQVQARSAGQVQARAKAEEHDRQVLAELRAKSRRGFLVGGIAAAAGLGLWHWLNGQAEVFGIAAPFRKALEFNAKLGRLLFQNGALAPEFDRAEAVKDFRRNGDVGLAEIDLKDWRLQLVGAAHAGSHPKFVDNVASWTYGLDPADLAADDSSDDSSDDETDTPPDPGNIHEAGAKGSAVVPKPAEIPEAPAAKMPGLLLTMEDVHKLPHVEMVTEFKCVEGWSEVVHWGGARMRDFLAAYPPVTRSGRPFGPDTQPDDIPEYVGFQTPDGDYYVGIEREVALHPQTLLAYELNGAPLAADHGAPLRLVTPLKYGIKQLKQIGRITYSDTRPHDYWHERGYDYYVGH